jgi:hypothetical protein
MKLTTLNSTLFTDLDDAQSEAINGGGSHSYQRCYTPPKRCYTAPVVRVAPPLVVTTPLPPKVSIGSF